MDEKQRTTPEDPPDVLLVARASAGDLRAFELLITRYQRAVFNIALYKSRNHFDAEDLTQDIFLAAFRALASLKEPESFAAWLFGIAYNRCHKWFRREKNKIVKFAEIRERAAEEERRRQKAAASGPATGPASGAASWNGDGGDRSDDQRDHISEHLQRLPSEIREVLTFKYLEGLSYEEIQKRVGINAYRIDYLIRKGKQLLRSRLARAEGTP
jgi:RNA polymerase sigma-70 factor (ECF subfamily)